MCVHSIGSHIQACFFFSPTFLPLVLKTGQTSASSVSAARARADEGRHGTKPMTSYRIFNSSLLLLSCQLRTSPANANQPQTPTTHLLSLTFKHSLAATSPSAFTPQGPTVYLSPAGILSTVPYFAIIKHCQRSWIGTRFSRHLWVLHPAKIHKTLLQKGKWMSHGAYKHFEITTWKAIVDHHWNMTKKV